MTTSLLHTTDSFTINLTFSGLTKERKQQYLIMHRYQSMSWCTSCRKSQIFFSPLQCHRRLIASPFLSFFFCFLFWLAAFFYIIYSPCISQNPMLDSMAFSGPASIITTYFNESSHMTIPLIKRENLHNLFFLWLIYTFFHFGVLFCNIFTYYGNQS